MHRPGKIGLQVAVVMTLVVGAVYGQGRCGSGERREMGPQGPRCVPAPPPPPPPPPPVADDPSVSRPVRPRPVPVVARPTCRGGRSLVDGVCECPASRPYVDSFDRCVAQNPSPPTQNCVVGASRVASRNQCVCDTATPNFNSALNRCVAPCVLGAQWVASRNQCVCDTATPEFDAASNHCVARAAPLGCPEGMLPVQGVSREGVRYNFCMDRTEVTVAAYRACPSCSAPNTGEFCNWNASGRENHPVNCVGAPQADAYCAWRGGRLPTEQEWQFAAQGPDGRTYPWGEAAPSSQLCWNRPSRAGTCVVGAYPSGRSPFGLDDMSGSVWEWTSSSEGLSYVLRGGCWFSNDPFGMRAAERWSRPAPRGNDVGFRCARGAP